MINISSQEENDKKRKINEEDGMIVELENNNKRKLPKLQK